MRLTSFNIGLTVFVSLFVTQAVHAAYEQWEVIEFEFEAQHSQDFPFEVEMGAVFSHIDSVASMRVPGFYNGGNQWLIRFSPPEVGKWEMTTYSSLVELSGKSKTFEVVKSSNPEQKGPVMVDPANRQKFMYADGTPYFALAFELDWLFALDHDNADDIPRTREILGHVAANGFNQVVMNVYAYDVRWGKSEQMLPKHDFSKPNTFPFLGTNEEPNHSALNVEFFQRFDRVIEHLAERGIIAHLMIYVWNKKVNWPEPDSDEDNRYFDYVVKRYQAYPHLIWDVSKEALAYGRDDVSYIKRRVERLRKLDGHGRLVTVHDYLYCSTHPETVDFISVQDWRPNIHSVMWDTLKRYPRHPVFNIEHGGYERTDYRVFDGSYIDPIECLRRNYLCVFAGVYSTYYWQNSSWYNVITDLSSLPEDKQPRFDLYKHLAQLFSDYNFHELEPAQFAWLSYVLTNHEDTYLLYVPDDMIAINSDFHAILGKTVTYKWFDPLNGVYSDPETREMKVPWFSVQKPELMNGQFAVLIVEIAGS